LKKRLSEALQREQVHLEEIEKYKDWQRMHKKIVQSFFQQHPDQAMLTPPGSPVK
jgi:hypothetical protein